MPKASAFNGFPKQCLDFYKGLAKNNNKLWFDSHRQDFDDFVLDPSRAFVFEMGKLLKKIAPGINADPRVNRSLFRIHRDTRFSKDKTPYKTHLAIWFWEGGTKRMECSGFYFHLEPQMLMLGAGLYRFPKELLETYRQAVVHPKLGPELVLAVKKVEEASYEVGGQHYKRTPRGFDPDHKNAKWLLNDGLFVGKEMKVPQLIHSEKLLDFCFEHFKKMAPLHKWLLNVINQK